MCIHLITKENSYSEMNSAFVVASVVPLQTEAMSPTDSEDRTPGRLQAVWPPPKQDEDDKVGLKYTEAGKNLKL